VKWLCLSICPANKRSRGVLNKAIQFKFRDGKLLSLFSQTDIHQTTSLLDNAGNLDFGSVLMANLLTHFVFHTADGRIIYRIGAAFTRGGETQGKAAIGHIQYNSQPQIRF
jgi:hypothetical protein